MTAGLAVGDNNEEREQDMKKPKYIKASNLPPRGIVVVPIFWWMFLDRMNAPDWLFGIVGTLLALVTITELWRMFAGEGVDVIGTDDR